MVQSVTSRELGLLASLFISMQVWLEKLPRSFGLHMLLLLAAGLMQAASMAWPVDTFWIEGSPIWLMQIAAMTLLAWVLMKSQSAKQAAWCGWFFACVSMCATFWWLYVAMHTFAGLPSWLAAFAVWGLAAPLSLYYAAAAWVFWYCSPRFLPWASVVFAAVWMLADMARGIWLTGFGWGAAGYAHLEGPLAWFAPWVGVYGIGFIAVALAMGLAIGFALHSRVAWGVTGVLFAASLLPIPTSISQWTESTGTLPVTLLQGNIPQDEKFETGSGVPLALQWYGEQLLQVNRDLVVAPETAIPILPQQLPQEYWGALRQHFSNGERAALIGIPLGNANDGYTNSVIGLGGENNSVWKYDKHHLVPFGEFIPPFFKWFTEMMNIPLGDFNRGSLGQTSFAFKGQRLAPNICYEDLFGEELAQRFVDADTAPTVFVNVSNMGWFGDNVAVHQHLNISRMRALEFERPFVRATNTGATVFINHRSQVGAALPHYTRFVLQGEVDGRHGITPYAWWVARCWLWPLWIFGVSLVALAWYGVTKPSRCQSADK